MQRGMGMPMQGGMNMGGMPNQGMGMPMQGGMPGQNGVPPQHMPGGYFDPSVSFEPFDPSGSAAGGMPSPIPAPMPTEGENAIPGLPIPMGAVPTGGGESFFRMDEQTITRIAEFVQNERNASIYYRNLSELADEENRPLFEQISEQCSGSSDSHNVLHKQFTGNEHTPADTEIIYPRTFQGGVREAVRVEAELLRELCDIYESLTERSHLEAVNKLIHRKTANLCKFYSILQE